MEWEDALEQELDEALKDPHSEEWMKRQRAAAAEKPSGVSEQLGRHVQMLQYLVDKLEQEAEWTETAGRVEDAVRALKVAIQAAKEAEYESTI